MSKDTRVIRKTLKWVRRLLTAVAVLLALLWLLQMILLPRILRAQVIARLAAMHLPDASVEVDHVSLTSATLRNLSAGTALSARVIHVTYTPMDLMHGRVDDIVIQGASIRPGDWPAQPAATAPATQPAGSTDQPPFSRLTVTQSRVEMPIDGKPASIPVEFEATERNHRVIASTDLTMSGYALRVRIDADPDFRSANAEMHLAGDLAQLPRLTNQKDLTLKGSADLSLSGRVSMGKQVTWNVEDIRVIGTVADAARGAVHAQDIKANIHLKAQGQGNELALHLLQDSSVTIASLTPSAKLPGFAISLQPKAADLEIWGGNWRLQAQNASLSLGDIKLELLPGYFGIHEKQAYGQISSMTDLAAVGHSGLLKSIWPFLAKMQLGGQLQVQLSRTFDKGALQQVPSVSVKLFDGTIGSHDYEMSAEGIAGEILFVDLKAPHSLPSQQLRMRYGKMGKWEVRDAFFQFTMPNLNTMDFEKSQLGWIGGMIWTDPFTLQLTNPTIRSRVYGRDLDLGKLVWVLAGEKAWAEGSVELDVPLVLRWPQMRFGEGYIQARPDGKLHLDYAAERLKQYLDATDPRFATDETYRSIRDRMVLALRDFRFSRLRAGLKRVDNSLHTDLSVTGKGASEGGQELNLNVSVTDLDWFISSYLALRRQQQ